MKNRPHAVTSSASDPAHEQLEALADALLWEEAEQPRRLEYSFHREANLRRAHRRDLQRSQPPRPDTSQMRQSPAQLLEALFAELDMPEMLVRVLSLVRRGLSTRQIAQAMGIREQAAARWRGRALEALQRHCRERVLRSDDPEARGAFFEQMSTSLYGREVHCPPGKEACRHDGICKHRWYLFQEETRE